NRLSWLYPSREACSQRRTAFKPSRPAASTQANNAVVYQELALVVSFYRLGRNRISRGHVSNKLVIAVGPNGDFAHRKLFAELEQARFRQKVACGRFLQKIDR